MFSLQIHTSSWIIHTSYLSTNARVCESSFQIYLTKACHDALNANWVTVTKNPRHKQVHVFWDAGQIINNKSSSTHTHPWCAGHKYVSISLWFSNTSPALVSLTGSLGDSVACRTAPNKKRKSKKQVELITSALAAFKPFYAMQQLIILIVTSVFDKSKCPSVENGPQREPATQCGREAERKLHQHFIFYLSTTSSPKTHFSSSLWDEWTKFQLHHRRVSVFNKSV